MTDAGRTVREYQSRLSREHQQRERYRANLRRHAKRLRFAWIEGHDTLYKFKSMAGNGCSEVQDMIENSRIYFSIPDQFNDPFDCAPVCKPAKPLSDPAFIQELLADEERMMGESGKSPEEVEELRKSQVDVLQLGPAVTAQTRSVMRADVRMFCLTSRQDHPLQWAHYADSHRGVCLHFRCKFGTLLGLARAVKYRKVREPVLVPLNYNPSPDHIADRMVQIKADFWRYESEYRIIGHDGADWGYTLDGRFCSFPPKQLCGVTLGMGTGAADRQLIMSWAANHVPALRVYEAVEDPDQFGLRMRWIA